MIFILRNHLNYGTIWTRDFWLYGSPWSLLELQLSLAINQVMARIKKFKLISWIMDKKLVIQMLIFQHYRLKVCHSNITNHLNNWFYPTIQTLFWIRQFNQRTHVRTRLVCGFVGAPLLSKKNIFQKKTSCSSLGWYQELVNPLHSWTKVLK